MTYIDFLLAFCGEENIDKYDFEKTLEELIFRNGFYLTPQQYFDLIVSENLNCVKALDTVIIERSKYDEYIDLKKFKQNASENLEKTKNLLFKLLMYIDTNKCNNDNLPNNIEAIIKELYVCYYEYLRLLSNENIVS